MAKLVKIDDGHTTKKLSGEEIESRKAKNRIWRELNKDKAKAYAKDAYRKNAADRCEYQREWYRANREHVRKQQAERRERNHVLYLLDSAKSRAKRHGVPFAISECDVFIPDKCPVLGIALTRSKGFASSCSPSIDRIIPKKGYVPGNIVVVSHKANRIKNDATMEELMRVIEFYKHIKT